MRNFLKKILPAVVETDEDVEWLREQLERRMEREAREEYEEYVEENARLLAEVKRRK